MIPERKQDLPEEDNPYDDGEMWGNPLPFQIEHQEDEEVEPQSKAEFGLSWD